MNQKQNSYGDNFQTAAQAAQVCLSGIKPLQGIKIALTFGRFGRIVNIKNVLATKIGSFSLLLDWKRKGVLVGSQQRYVTFSVVPFILSTTTVSKGLGLLVEQKLDKFPAK